jgi:hypothetical protein
LCSTSAILIRGLHRACRTLCRNCTRTARDIWRFKVVKIKPIGEHQPAQDRLALAGCIAVRPYYAACAALPSNLGQSRRPGVNLKLRTSAKSAPKTPVSNWRHGLQTPSPTDHKSTAPCSWFSHFPKTCHHNPGTCSFHFGCTLYRKTDK